MLQNYTKQVRENFAAISDLYAELWGEYFHLAWLTHDDEDLKTAFKRMHQRYLCDAKVAEAEWIIDLACGPGKFSALVAQHTRGQVLGIDLSEVQLAKARKHMRDNLTFLQHDIMQVDALRQQFDAAFLLDAACYLPDRRLALKGTVHVKQGINGSSGPWHEPPALHPIRRRAATVMTLYGGGLGDA